MSVRFALAHEIGKNTFLVFSNELEHQMEPVTVSSKYRIVIPREIREQFNIQPGQAMQFFLVDGRIELVPVLPIQSLRGRYKGLDCRIDRSEDRL